MALTKAHNRMIEGAAVNVKDFGAVGDGVTDDTAAIQAAINSSGKVFFPRGTYSHTDLNVYSSTLLVGEGKNKSILRARSGTTNSLYFSGTDATYITNISIHDLSIDGNSNATNGIYLDRVQRNPTLKDIEIYGCTTGLRLRRVFNAYVHGWFHNNTTGILLDSGANANTFDSCLIHSNTIGADTADSLDLATGGGGFGGPYYGVLNNLFLNCDIEENSTGIRLQFNTAFNTIDGCYFENNLLYGASIFGNGTADADGNRIVNSSFTGSGSRINIGGDAVFTYIVGNFANGIGGGNYLINLASNTDKIIIRSNRNYGAGAGVVDLAGIIGTNVDIDYFDGNNRYVHMNNGRVVFQGGFSPRFSDGLFISSGNSKILSGSGTPEGSVSASIGSLFLRTDGSTGTTLYVKESGTGNTGWVAK